jgi:hypothetical protein
MKVNSNFALGVRVVKWVCAAYKSAMSLAETCLRPGMRPAAASLDSGDIDVAKALQGERLGIFGLRSSYYHQSLNPECRRRWGEVRTRATCKAATGRITTIEATQADGKALRGGSGGFCRMRSWVPAVRWSPQLSLQVCDLQFRRQMYFTPQISHVFWLASM